MGGQFFFEGGGILNLTLTHRKVTLAERRKKETPLILYTKFRDMEQKSLYQNSARTGSHYISSAYTVIGSFFLISSQEQPTHLSTWMANKDRNSIPLKYNKQKTRFPRI